jgi:ATP-dependent helicase IRC3
MTSERMFSRQYDLSKARHLASKCKELEEYQSNAVTHFSMWYESHKVHSNNAGEILFLPTGAGKTNVAIRFLCEKPLSDGYKVLWLAHTHHLLEQAFYSFEGHVGKIFEPKTTLSVRVVSGTKGHFRIHAIDTTDDVIIATLQTITKAYNERHPALESFLNSAKGKIFLVFDEAHHAPAPSYRRLIMNLRERYPQMYLLGLTATPYSKKEGWLARIFPQHFINIISPSELMAQGILAEPIPEPVKTDIVPDFDEREYKEWIGDFRENLPEEIITKLAKNRERNLIIAKYYVKNRDRLGKAIIFADRWFQCEQISKFLENQGVENGTIYTHIPADPDGNADARNKRKDDENASVLKKFRDNEIQVLINVRMLTEGTDIPDVQTVFITMQTTSQNLLTQMIGRALRGPKFGGTKLAYLVFFIDNWKQLINWADYQPLVDTVIIDKPEPPSIHLPVFPISIELVRKLADMMYRPGTFIDPFRTLLPLGWYMVEYVARAVNSDSVNGDEVESDKSAENHSSDEKLAISEEIESIKRLVMVFEHEEDNYKRIIQYLLSPHPTEFEDEGIQFKDFEPTIAAWSKTFFPNVEEHFGSNLAQDIFSIVRHIAQNDEAPKFFKFEERDNHDLDRLARDMLDNESCNPHCSAAFCIVCCNDP